MLLFLCTYTMLPHFFISFLLSCILYGTRVLKMVLHGKHLCIYRRLYVYKLENTISIKGYAYHAGNTHIYTQLHILLYHIYLEKGLIFNGVFSHYYTFKVIIKIEARNIFCYASPLWSPNIKTKVEFPSLFGKEG